MSVILIPGVSVTAAPSFIAGLKLEWVSATSLKVNSGTAYIESAAASLQAPTAITKSSLSLTSSTWYHVYLYNNAGTPDAEVVTTAPEVPYKGTARSKTGDTSRRYLGSVYSLAASGGLAKFVQDNLTMTYLESITGAPFYVLNNGVAITNTNVALSGAIPTTAVNATLFAQNLSATIVVNLSNADANFTLSNTLYMAFVLADSALIMTLPVDASKQVQYRFRSTPPANGLYLFVSGYTFER